METRLIGPVEQSMVPVLVRNHDYWYNNDDDAPEYVEMEKPVCYITVYAISRHYGGAEEGGWWYNWLEPVCSVPLIEPGNPAEVEAIIAFLKPRFDDEGDIYSVRGGVAHAIYREYRQGQNASEERPRYE
jgi:hypothetical protein